MRFDDKVLALALARFARHCTNGVRSLDFGEDFFTVDQIDWLERVV